MQSNQPNESFNILSYLNPVAPNCECDIVANEFKRHATHDMHVNWFKKNASQSMINNFFPPNATLEVKLLRSSFSTAGARLVTCVDEKYNVKTKGWETK